MKKSSQLIKVNDYLKKNSFLWLYLRRKYVKFAVEDYETFYVILQKYALSSSEF